MAKTASVSSHSTSVPIGLQAIADRGREREGTALDRPRDDETTDRVSLRGDHHPPSVGTQIVEEISEQVLRRVDRKLAREGPSEAQHDREIVKLIVGTVLPVALDAAFQRITDFVRPAEQADGQTPAPPPPPRPKKGGDAAALFAIKTAMLTLVLCLTSTAAGLSGWVSLDDRTAVLENRTSVIPELVRFSLELADHSVKVSEDSREMLRRIAEGLNTGSKIVLDDLPERAPPKPPVSLRRLALESETDQP